MKRRSIVILLFLLAFSSFTLTLEASLPSVSAAPISEPMLTATSTQTVSLTLKYPTMLVQPRINPTYRFALNGAVYAWSNLSEDNMTVAPSITGFNPTLTYNSTLYKYSATILGCTINILYKPIGASLKQTITGSGCPTGAYSVNLSNVKGFGSRLQNSCTMTYKTISYAWCDAIASGISVSTRAWRRPRYPVPTTPIRTGVTG